MIFPRALALLSLILSSSALAQANAKLPPPPADPTLAGLYGQVKEMFPIASAPGYMDWPAEPKPWPCDVSELQVRKLASPLARGDGENDPLIEKAIKLGRRSAGAGGSSKTTISDVRFAALEGNCKEGKLEGPVEFFVEYTRLATGAGTDMETRYRERTRALVSQGEPAIGQPQVHAMLELSNSMHWHDPTVENMMKKAPKIKTERLTVQVNQFLSRVIGHTAQIALSKSQGAEPIWNTLLSQPIGPQSVESYVYLDGQLHMILRVKNLQQHGEQRHFAINFNGVTLPSFVQCFEDGEEIKTTKCDVN